MKHKIYIFTLAAALLTGCANDDFVGQGDDGDVAINFGIVTGGATRAEKTGADAAADLGGSFVVYGDKSGDGGTHIVVFDHYNVEFVDGTANSTVSNYKGWEYVGVTPVNKTGTTNIEDFDPVANQTIKYWDKTQVEYDFFAFSKGHGNAKFSKVNTANLASSTNPVYTISGAIDDLAKAYVADVVVVKDKDKFSREHPVTPKFRSVAAKLRIGIYETIPGYSVKDIKFYADDATTTTGTDACLFASSEVFPTTGEGIVNVYFPDAGYHAKTEFVSNNPDANSRTLWFSSMVLGAEKESNEKAEGPFIGRTSATATYTNADKSAAFKNVCAIGSGHALSIKVDYTLVPTDGQAGGAITIKGTMATVPAIYTDWQPNYAYTYIFKISDDSGDGLYPITFDAAEIVDGGPHETDTENAKTSITTYQKGVNITANNEYLPEQSIYVTVGNYNTNYNTFTLETDDYWKEGYIHLFKATVENGAVQGIDELSVSNCFTYGTYDATAKTYTVTDINGKKLVLTDVTESSLEILDAIPAEDGPNGQSVSATNAIARIIDPDPSSVYVFQYLHWPATPTEVEFNTLPKGNDCYGITYIGNQLMLVKKSAEGTETFVFPGDMKGFTFDATLVTGALTNGNKYYRMTEEQYTQDGKTYDAIQIAFYKADGTETNDGTYYVCADATESGWVDIMKHVTQTYYDADTEYNTLPTGQVVYWFDSASHANRKHVADGTETSASFTGKVMTTQPEFAYKVIRVK